MRLHRTRKFELQSNDAPLLPAVCLFNAIRKTRPSEPVVGVCLEGDTTLRLRGTAELFRAGTIDRVIVSGGVNNPLSDHLPAAAMKEYLVAQGIPASVIHVEDQSKSTYDHPLYVNPLAQARGFTKLLIITSGYHLLRAYLRFLKQLSVDTYAYTLYGHAVGTGVAWFQRSPSEGRYRICGFYHELTKIRTYGPRGHLASFSEAWDYVRSLRSA